MAFNILSIDDEMDMQALLQQKFRRQIRKGELKFSYAANGQEGLDFLIAHPEINMALVDINMPVMDGLTFLNEVAKLNRHTLKIVIMSAYGDMRNIRQAMNRGAFDFINKPIDFSDLETTIQKTQERIEYLKNQQQELRRLTQMENEIKAAAQIQFSLLPQINGSLKSYPQVEIGSFIKPARFVGGDFYDVFSLDDTHLGFLIADVSGKGISAAAFMLVSHTAISIYAHQQKESNKVLQWTNNYLEYDNKECMFTTTFYGVLNVKTGRFVYSNGGHNPPLLVHDADISNLEKTHNSALGIIGDSVYNKKEIQLADGDLMVMYTDGVNEAQNSLNQEFGMDRIRTVILNNIQESPSTINTNIFRSLEEFRGSANQFDDITLLSFRWNKPV